MGYPTGAIKKCITVYYFLLKAVLYSQPEKAARQPFAPAMRSRPDRREGDPAALAGRSRVNNELRSVAVPNSLGTAPKSKSNT
jgi:hypothetical protein